MFALGMMLIVTSICVTVPILYSVGTMGTIKALAAVSLVAANVKAALSSTGFTISMSDIDYFLPPRPVAKIFRCKETQTLFDDAPFVPFTVVKGDDSVMDVASFIEHLQLCK